MHDMRRQVASCHRGLLTPPLSRLLLAALVAVPVLLGCGRGAREVAEDVSHLEITRYRLNLDDKQGVARIVAEVTNTGENTVREAAVTAILKGPGDEKRGINRTIVKDIQPGRPRVFSMTVTMRGRERGVEFHITPPDVDVEEDEDGVEGDGE